jgi:serine/threonine protein phosphatase PrpC
VGRSIGDQDAGSCVVPMPHLRQLLVPSQGIRLVLASDGLWDLMTPDKAAKIVRQMVTEDAASALVAAAAADRWGCWPGLGSHVWPEIRQKHRPQADW